jgi:RsiW-degrading membrane proteinase PrsW (M82 family)
VALSTFGYAFVGGLLPSLVWLYFLLKEDSRNPEPRSVVTLAFLVGMAAVPLAIPLEQFAKSSLAGTLPVLTAWALIEEALKYAAAAVFILWRPAVDEAPDYVMYLITVALGFAAVENMFFLLTPLSDGQVASSFLTGDLRFVGSTLLHIVASATLGFALAFSDESPPTTRIGAGALGLILAVALHTVFNALIITGGASTTLAAVFFVWTAALVLLAVFEVLKYFQYRNLPPIT